MLASRVISPEQLDELPPTAPAAARSRRDLQRLNWVMNHAELLAAPVKNLGWTGPARIVELGAGDGVLALQWARKLSKTGLRGEILLIDQHQLLSEPTAAAFRRVGWEARAVARTIDSWVEGVDSAEADLVMANLFLHHFPDDVLRRLFAKVSSVSKAFVCCEPERSWTGLAACSFLWAIGCGPVTRHDAPVSVRAGFKGEELSALWPNDSGWMIEEHRAGLFSHVFAARKERE